MPTLASDILIEARSLLNDPTGAIYTTTPMIPILNKVYKELQTKMSALGISTTKEVSAVVPVVANTVRLGDGAGLPASLVYPISVQERPLGTTGRFIDMTEFNFEPIVNPARTRLEYWCWREEEIKFPGSSTDREVLIRFVQTIGTITATTSPVLILNSQQWISQRVAAVAALVLGSNPSRAEELNKDLVQIWDDLRATLIRRKQNIPVRRRRTRYRVL